MGLNEFTGFSKHHQSLANMKEEMLRNVNKHLSGVLLNICMLLIKLAAMNFRGNTLAEMKLSIKYQQTFDGSYRYKIDGFWSVIFIS